jgi:hypothetical protein
MNEKDLKIPEEFERKDSFTKALKEFLLEEKFLLENNLNERTITHKLAEHLKAHFCDYDVDCEYNRMPKNNKNMTEEYITKRLNLDIKKVKTDDDNGQTVFPDIIIHKRGENEQNYLVIEVKKKKFANEIIRGSKEKETHRDFDKKKLKAYTKTKELKYKFGVYLEFNGKGISEMKFFKDGKELEIS